MSFPNSPLKMDTAGKDPQYHRSRRFWLIGGCVILACTTIFQSNFFNRSLGMAPSLRKTHNVIFELDTSDSWKLNLDGKEIEEGIFNGNPKNKPPPEELKKTLITTSLRNGVETDGMWEWHYIHDDNRVFKQKKRHPRKMLIAQFSSTSTRTSQFMEIVKPVNIAYAKEWNHDIVFLNAAGQSSRKVNPSTLLAKAWELRGDYEQVLILDADAMFHDFTRDVTKLLHPLDVVRAKRQQGEPLQRTSNVMSPVTLWNLRHMLTPKIQMGWNDQWKIGQSKESADFLKRALVPYEEEVNTVKREFSGFDSAWIKFLDAKDKESKTSFEKLNQKLEFDARKICQKYNLDCTKQEISKTKSKEKSKRREKPSKKSTPKKH